MSVNPTLLHTFSALPINRFQQVVSLSILPTMAWDVLPRRLAGFPIVGDSMSFPCTMLGKGSTMKTVQRKGESLQTVVFREGYLDSEGYWLPLNEARGVCRSCGGVVEPGEGVVGNRGSVNHIACREAWHLGKRAERLKAIEKREAKKAQQKHVEDSARQPPPKSATKTKVSAAVVSSAVRQADSANRRLDKVEANIDQILSLLTQPK